MPQDVRQLPRWQIQRDSINRPPENLIARLKRQSLVQPLLKRLGDRHGSVLAGLGFTVVNPLLAHLTYLLPPHRAHVDKHTSAISSASASISCRQVWQHSKACQQRVDADGNWLHQTDGKIQDKAIEREVEALDNAERFQNHTRTVDDHSTESVGGVKKIQAMERSSCFQAVLPSRPQWMTCTRPPAAA